MRGKMLPLVMQLNIVLFAYCDGFIADNAMWYVVDFSFKIFQSLFVVERTLLLVCLRRFAYMRLYHKKYDVSNDAQTLKQHANASLNNVRWTYKTTQQWEAIVRGRLLWSVYTINRHRQLRRLRRRYLQDVSGAVS